MSREIKFRAFDRVSKKVREVFQIHFDSKNYNLMLKTPTENAPDHWCLRDFDQVELMQYIGLKDKNGVDIYEGDLIVMDVYPFFDDGKSNYVGEVQLIFSSWQYVLTCVNPDKNGISEGINELLNPDGYEEGAITQYIIIGNIYENPELLGNENLRS